MAGKYGARERYDAANVRHYTLKFNKKTDADLIEYLDNAPNIQGAIKAALRAQMKKTSK